MEASERRTLEGYDYERLVPRAQDGDRGACEELVRSSSALVKKIVYSTAGPSLCEDAYQETYLIAFKKIRQLKNSGAFPSWISRIALHVSYDLRKKVKVEDELDDVVSAPDHADTVADAVSLKRALSQLHSRDRDVILLREFLQLSYEQVAKTLQVPVGTVRSRLHKARGALLGRLRG